MKCHKHGNHLSSGIKKESLGGIVSEFWHVEHSMAALEASC